MSSLSLLNRLRRDRHGRKAPRFLAPVGAEDSGFCIMNTAGVPFPTSTVSQSQPRLDRRIVADPSHLLEPDESEDFAARGLMPPRTKKRSMVERIPVDIYSPAPPSDVRNITPTYGASSSASNLAAWATFGRNAACGSPQAQEHESNSPVDISTEYGTTLSAIRSHSTSQQPHESSHISSSPSTQSRTATQSSTTHSTRSTRTRNENYTVPHDSPCTFGNSSFLHALSSCDSASASPPPPLPPLIHPDLFTSLSSHSYFHSRTVHKKKSTNLFHRSGSSHGRTYPPRRRHTNLEDLILPTSQQSVRRHASLSRVQNIFRTHISSAEIDQESSRLPHSKTVSHRRTSAEWRAQQATLGATSSLPSEFGWLAQRMVGISLETSERSRPANAGPRALHARTPCGRHPFHLIPSQSPPSCALLEESIGDRDRGYTPVHHDYDQSMAEQTDVLPTPETPKKTIASRVVHRSKTRNRRVFHGSPNAVPSTSKVLQPSRASSLQNSFVAAGPTASPVTPGLNAKTTARPSRSTSEPRLKSVLETPKNPKGKRKADTLEVTPPDSKAGHHATFVVPPEARRRPNLSETSRPPSSYHRKRPRLSDTSTSNSSPGHSRPTSGSTPAQNGSWPTRSAPAPPLSRIASHSTSMRSMRSTPRPESVTGDRRRSMSEISFPISALVTPHAPSISMSRSSAYHMHDPRKPKTVPTEWSLRFKSEDEEASPLQAWCFFIGFILFPLWWAASFSPVPKTREVGGTDTEKAVTLDDPQVERDARTWRNRCRIMAGISFVTYIPFIVLVAVFVPR